MLIETCPQDESATFDRLRPKTFAYRRSVIAGALVALRLIEAAAVVGVALGMGRFDIAVDAAGRLALDMAFVIGAGLLVFGAKQALVHRRTPIR